LLKADFLNRPASVPPGYLRITIPTTREGSHNSRTEGSTPGHLLSKILMPVEEGRWCGGGMNYFKLETNQYDSQEECADDQES
jgi:hypothetical protein